MINQFIEQISSLQQQINEQRDELRRQSEQIQNLINAPVFQFRYQLHGLDGILNKISEFVCLSSGGSPHPSYPITRLIKYDADNIDKYYFNYYYNNEINHGKNTEKDGWVEFDFKLFKVDIFSYTIRSTPYEANKYHHPKSWKIVGSNDRNNWDIIDQKLNNGELNGKSRQVCFQCNIEHPKNIVTLDTSRKMHGVTEKQSHLISIVFIFHALNFLETFINKQISK